MKRVAIPTPTPDNLPAAVAALKHNVDMSTGQVAGSPALKALDPATATTADIVAAVNALIRRVQGDV